MNSTLDLSVVRGGDSATSYVNASARELRIQHRSAVLMLLKKQVALSGLEVRLLRERMHCSHRQLAEKLSIAPSVLSDWESGAVVLPAVEVRFRLCCAEHIGITLNIRTVLCSLVQAYREHQSALSVPPQRVATGR